MKKIAFLIPIVLLLAAACNQEKIATPNAGPVKLPAESAGTPAQAPVTSAKPPIAKPSPGDIKQNQGGTQSYSNIQNNSTTINSSSSSGNSSSSSVIQTSSSANNNSTLSLNLDSASFPAAAVGQRYSADISFQQSGNQEIFVGLSGLPPGIGLAAGGLPGPGSSITLTNPGPAPSVALTGTPTEAGNYNVTITLDNKNGTVITQQFSLNVNP